MDREPDFIDQVHALQRLRSSANGNPRYRVCFTHQEGYYVTSSDRSFCYSIENPDMRGPVAVWLTKAGYIGHMEPSHGTP